MYKVYHGYQVYDDGVMLNKKGKILKCGPRKDGYCLLKLYYNYEYHAIYFHQLVMELFVGPCPENKEINHIDGNKSNNKLSNLEYITRSQNMNHAYKLGLCK